MKLKIKDSNHLKHLTKILVYSGYGVTTIYKEDHYEVIVWECVINNFIKGKMTNEIRKKNK